MSGQCKVCGHTRRAQIEDMIISGVTARNIGLEYAVSEQSISRHKLDHMPADMLAAYQHQRRMEEVLEIPDKMAAEWQTTESLLGLALRVLVERKGDSVAQVEEAIAALNVPFVLGLLRQRHRYFETMLRVLGAMPAENVSNVVITSSWREIVREVEERIGNDPNAKAYLAGMLTDLPQKYLPQPGVEDPAAQWRGDDSDEEWHNRTVEDTDR
jgi:hypothetical protein